MLPHGGRKEAQMAVEYSSFGAAREVTGSKHLFSFGDSRILLDCGVFQGHRLEAYRRNVQLPFKGAEITDAVLSHGHFDHCGNLPTLHKAGYQGNIYATPATRDIANLVLMDSAHLQATDVQFLRQRRPASEAVEPLYAVREVLAALEQFVTVNLHRPLTLNGGVKCELLGAGHILGAAMIHLTFPRQGNQRGLEILYTGDLGRHGMPIIRDPEPFPEVDYILCESTYGNRLHEPIDEASNQLADVVNETVRKGGKIIIPAFAVERTQELIYFLHLLTDAKRIPSLDVFVDSPLAVNATSVFRVHPECYNQGVYEQFLDHHKNPFGFEQVHYTTGLWESRALNDRKFPCIIIAGSGMCEGGRILHHLKHNIEDPNNTVLIVGYMGENTLGRKLADRASEVNILGKTYKRRCRVKILNTFSAHADYQDICNAFAPVNRRRLQGIFLVHGEPEAQEALKARLGNMGFDKVHIPREGETLRLG